MKSFIKDVMFVWPKGAFMREKKIKLYDQGKRSDEDLNAFLVF